MSRRSGYDYIVIGAGSAGCVIANRLSEDPTCRVLVIDAGRSDDSVFYRRPGMLALVYQVPELKKKADWGYRTVPQKYMDNRSMPWTRGKLLGGCSTVNGMLYLRGHRDNYDEWRDLGNPGWGYDDVLPYFRKSECHEDGASTYHGGTGPLQVTRQRGISIVSEAFQDTVAEFCCVPVLDDFNGPHQEGAGVFQMTCRDRRRSSAAVAFLHPALRRPNLNLVHGAHVERIEMEGHRAVGVRYFQGGKLQTVRASSEIILSAGAIGSPHILMLSGVGPAKHLARRGVQPILDLRGVGENLQDHLLMPVRFRATQHTGHTSTAGHFLAGLFTEFVLNEGWFGKTFLEGGAFIRSASSAPRPDIQMHSIPWAYPEPNDDGPDNPVIAKEHSFTVMPSLLYPKSRGTIRLHSRNPMEAPLIDPSYFQEDDDMKLLLRGVSLTREIAHAKPLSEFIRGEATPGPQVTSESALRAEIRLRAKTVFHPVGTCKMGIDDLAVVDPELRVHGLTGLRIADASVMPRIPGGNTNAPCIMIGEKAADMIRSTRGYSA